MRRGLSDSVAILSGRTVPAHLKSRGSATLDVTPKCYTPQATGSNRVRLAQALSLHEVAV